MVTIVNSVDTTHEDMVHDAQMDFYGTKLATCSSDKTIKIFSCTGGHSQHQNASSLIADLRGHEGHVWQIAWAHPMYGSVLASCGYDKRIIVWKEQAPSSSDGTAFAPGGNAAPKWEKIYENKDHASSVNSVCWAPYDIGLVLAAGSSDGTISVHTYQQLDGSWEVRRIQNAHALGCNAVSWAPSTPPNAMMDMLNGQNGNGSASSTSDSSSVATAGLQQVKKIVSGGCDKIVKIWSCKAGGEWECEEKLEAHSDWVRDVAWAPSIGLPRSLIASCGQDKCVYLWEKDGQTGKWNNRLLHSFPDVIYHLSWSLLGNVLAVSSGDNTVTLWKEMTNGEWACVATDVGKAVQGTTPSSGGVDQAAAAAAQVDPQQQRHSQEHQHGHHHHHQQQQQQVYHQQYQQQAAPMMPATGAIH
jgi:protein transport protein SEC13